MFGGCFLPTWTNQMVCGDDVIKSEGAQPILLWHRQMVVWWLYVTYVVNIFPSFTLYRSFSEGLKVSSPCACTWPKYEGLLDQGLGWDQSRILSHVLRSPYLQNTSKHWQKSIWGVYLSILLRLHSLSAPMIAGYDWPAHGEDPPRGWCRWWDRRGGSWRAAWLQGVQGMVGPERGWGWQHRQVGGWEGGWQASRDA